MADLYPMPLASLLARMMREIDGHDAAFDLPLSACFFGSASHDLGVAFHGRRAATPLGPAAGPHSQMAQNLVLAWLGGSRIMELKTVQVLDELVIPRPCIDMRTVGFNVEWSQELKLEESVEEYIKGAMLIEVLKTKFAHKLAPGFTDTVFDMSVGYDLKGIQGKAVRRFIETMMDSSKLVARLRDEIPAEYRSLRDLDFPVHLSDTLTLSTFHGCPPDEIEQILEHLMREYGLNVIVKLNPTLLGRKEVDRLLHDVMGYELLRTPDAAFEKDTTWDLACGFVERLRDLADALGVGFGVKFTNTLTVEHGDDFLPESEALKYLSGPPLHVLAMNLVGRFRERFGAGVPVSFSAGIDNQNFADAVSLGLTPITVCTDLLKPRGYARQASYFKNLLKRMDDVGATSIDEFIRRAHADEDDGALEREPAVLRNTDHYVRQVTVDPRYGSARNGKPPKKTGTSLELFNCLTCDKCIPVCPNDANFAMRIPKTVVPVLVCRVENGEWHCTERGVVELSTKHQIGNFADFCNECGNCDIFCPEDGGPYIVKPRFFGSDVAFDEHAGDNGFLVLVEGQTVRMRGRFDAGEFTLSVTDGSAEYSGEGFRVRFSVDDAAGTIEGDCDAGVEVDLTYALILDLMRRWVLDGDSVNYVNAAAQ